ncbi:MAG: hypothetical protein WAM66_09540 [Acidobacteriaceae bacterium]
MSLQVPPEHVMLLKKWLELPDDEIEKYSSALARVKPEFNAEELAKAILLFCPLNPNLVFGITEILITVYRTGEPQKPFEAFLDRDVKPALQRGGLFSGTPDERDVQWTRLRRFLLGAIQLEQIVGTTAKAGVVLTEHERIFDGVRIFTDFRPIYHADVAEKPTAGVVIHMLKITNRDKQGRRFDVYYALDSNDLEKMRGTLNRAAEKEKTLRQTMEDAGLLVLNVQLSY